MPEIAYTSIGRNTLFAGLISHIAAILVAMMSASGREHFFCVVFFLSSIIFVAGAFAELKNRGYRPFLEWRLYVITAVTVLPLLGPLIILGLVYSMPKMGKEERVSLPGLLPASFRLRANGRVLFLLIVFLFILFFSASRQDDPYFKKRYRNDPHSNLPQSVLAACLHRDYGQIVKIFSR
jgi:predicted membrane channel-forming protein YqfA (hemolysin III family)